VETVDPIYIAIILYISAIVLALVDLYVPSAGMLVLLSIVAAVGSVIFGFQRGTTSGMTMLTLVAATIPILGVIAIRIWPHTPIGRRIVLGLPAALPTTANEQHTALAELIGYVIVSEYPLMPSGQITIDHRPYNALAEAGYIDAGQRIEVVSFRQRDLIVRITDKPLTPIRPRDQIDGIGKQPVTETAGYQNLLDVPANELGLDSLED
jgi:membrane-bound ClpP family serine protease